VHPEQEEHKEIRVSEAKKVCQEIVESKVSKVNRDTWVFQEMPVKKVRYPWRTGR
jgi:hypothetical protein